MIIQGAPKKKRTRRRNTAHLKDVPGTLPLREAIRLRCREVAEGLDPHHPLSKDELERVAREILIELQQPAGFLGWVMVTLSSAFWQDQVAAVPPEKRLFLLPHCLKHSEGCPADYDQFGLDCKTCGACSIADFRGKAEEMGYRVLVAEGSPVVLKIIVSGYVDAIVGVACLNVLEKAIDKLMLAGIPCMAVPLLSSDCRNTSVDEEWVSEMVATPYVAAKAKTRSYLHLLRGSAQLFETKQLERLIPRTRGETRLSEINDEEFETVDPIAATEMIAADFLAKGGKYSRPFITLACYDAASGSDATLGDGASVVAGYSDSVLRAALSIETFHKASLIHDDIQDEDDYRYGEPALHKKYGVPTAINLGDYMIGMGYRLVSGDAAELGGDVAADILSYLSEAHQRLSEGQGAELLWRRRTDKRLKPIDALKVYALKTAPAFEAAFFTGLRLAGPIDEYRQPVRAFARNLGVAFQIINDLKDWEGDQDNKLNRGADFLAGRPTVLWALALEELDESQQEELIDLVDDDTRHDHYRLQCAERLFKQAGVFERAQRLIEKHQQKAEEIADQIEPETLRRLFYYLIDTVLHRSSEFTGPTIDFVEPTLSEALPVITK